MSIPQRIILLTLVATALAGETEKQVETKPKRGLDLGLGDLGGHGGLEGLGGEIDGLSLGGALEAGTRGLGRLERGDKGRISGITIHREVPVDVPAPYLVERHVPVPVKVDNPVPYHVAAPYPVPVEKKIYVPVHKNIPVPVSVPVKVPYKVAVPIEREIPVPVLVKSHGHGSWGSLGGHGGLDLSGLHH